MKWIEVNYSQYEIIYKKLGGSFITFPPVIRKLSEIINVKTKYYCYKVENEIQACIPTWEDWIAGSNEYLKLIRESRELDKRRLFDFGYPEYILPISKKFHAALPFKCNFISDIHKDQITNLLANPFYRCLAKKPLGEMSSRSRNDLNRKLKKFLLCGGEIEPIQHLCNTEIVDSYRILFNKRWQFPPRANDNLIDVLRQFRANLFGFVLYFERRIIALQIVYYTLCNKYAVFEYVNGGYDPELKYFSPGSILYYLNIKEAEKITDRHLLSMRYSFGMDDEEYKNRWCRKLNCYSVNPI